MNLGGAELLGYAASILVAVSLMLQSILRLRLVNTLGALLFTAYGLLVGAAPVAAVNAFIVGINLWYLRGMLGSRRQGYFELLEVAPEDAYLRRFLEHHAADIARYQPDFETDVLERDGVFALFALRDAVPAGLVIARRLEAGEAGSTPGEASSDAWIELDYAIPGYRDLETGRFVFGEGAAQFKARGIGRLRSRSGTDEHRKYLERMGFESPRGDADWLVRKLT